MDIRKTRTCEHCKAVVLLDKVRLFPKDKDKNLLLCDNCCDNFKKSAAAPSSRVSSLPKPEYVNYACTRCVYTFRLDTSKAGITYNVHCPYCGKNDRLQQK